MPAGILGHVARADWLTAERAKAWRNVFLAMAAIAVVAWCGLSTAGVDLRGRPLGTDFLSFYAASKLALAGKPSAVYDVVAHQRAELQLFGQGDGYTAFFYPPLFLLVCLPLALLPYFPALVVWLTATGGLWLAVVRKWMGASFSWPTVLAFPALVINAGHGQNAFLSGALLGAGALGLNRRPWSAGVAFGLLAFKPHLGVALPIALLLWGEWKTIVAAAACLLTFATASVMVFGPTVWSGFLSVSSLARATLEQGLVEPGKMVSAFAAARVLGASTQVAYLVQIALAAYLFAVIARARCSDARDARGPLLVLCALLASPFLLDYDLVAIAFPLIWVWREGLRDGFRSWEKSTLLVGFALPVIARPLATVFHAPVAPVVLVALLAIVQRRMSSRDPVLAEIAAVGL